jgi:arylformamidase
MTDAAIDTSAEFDFVGGQVQPTWPPLIEGFARASEATAARTGVRLDVAYGPHPRQVFDFVPAKGAPRAIVVHLHPGWWQMRDKALFRFMAERFADLGCDTVLANYPLAPDASIAEITEAVRAIVPAVRADAEARLGHVPPIVASGHSAGAHLAVELALTDPSAWGLAASPIAAVLALSGVYELSRLTGTSLNRALKLDAEAAHAASPVHRATSAPCPALFAVGGVETAAFVAQSRDMSEAWEAAGRTAPLIVAPGADHFTLLTRFMDPADPLGRAVADLIDGAAA